MISVTRRKTQLKSLIKVSQFAACCFCGLEVWFVGKLGFFTEVGGVSCLTAVTFICFQINNAVTKEK